MPGKFWTKDEVDWVREHYQTMTCQEMAAALPGRTKKSIEHYVRNASWERTTVIPDRHGTLVRTSEPYFVKKYAQQISYINYKCENCGEEKPYKATAIRKNQTKNCDCHRRENCSKAMKRLNEEGKNYDGSTHKLSGHRLYRIYYGMLTRCYSEKCRQYKDYGGRGIIICEEWLNDFTSFFNWALSSEWKCNLTIDRINVNGNYCPNNCRWITMREQGSNRRNNIMITAWNEIKPLPEWIRDSRCPNLDYATVKTRIKNYRWSPEEAISKPVLR